MSAPDHTEKAAKIHHTGSRKTSAIEHWCKTGKWPSDYLAMNTAESSENSGKRGRSYTETVRRGDNPLQYSPGYEQVLEQAGIFMSLETRKTISAESKSLCDVLLNSFFPPPTNSLFGNRSFVLALNALRSENEPRVQRDITPLLVPCVSLLYLQERIQKCEHLSAKVQNEWTKVMALAGPLPKPDYCVGLMPSAFTADEVKVLRTYSSPVRPTLFRDGFYFPFLMCEVCAENTSGSFNYIINASKVKCGEQGVNVAERQNMHSASIAVNTIVELYRDPAVASEEELDGKILAFSISHDHRLVLIHGHYARVTAGEKTTLHRHLLVSFTLDGDDKVQWKAYHIVRKIYDHFAPVHVARIKSAIEKLSKVYEASRDDDSSVLDANNSQVESTTGLSSSSPNNSSAKRRKILNKKQLEVQVDVLSEQLQKQRRELEEKAKEEKKEAEKKFEERERKYEEREKRLEEKAKEEKNEAEKKYEEREKRLEEQLARLTALLEKKMG